MKVLTLLSIVAMVAILFCPPLLAAEMTSAESSDPDEALVKA